MRNLKVSIVVPVYNVAKYLHECLDSIVNQTYKNIEVIVVDDGSTDGSGVICDEYAQSDNRVVVYHKKNGGVGSAYNYGVSHTTGEYIAFVESDDWVEPNMIELLLEKALQTNSEIVKAPFWYYDSFEKEEDKRNIIYNTPIKTSTGVKNLVDFYSLAKIKTGFTIDVHPELVAYHASLWSYLYKANFVKQIHFVECPGAGYVDMPFVFEVLCRAKTISVIDQPVLHWRNDSQQHLHSTNEGGIALMKIFDRARESLDIIRKYGKQEVLREAFWAGMVHCIFFFFYRIKVKYKQEYWNEMKQFFSILDHDSLFRGTLLTQDEKSLLWQVIHRRFISPWPKAFTFSHIKRWCFSLHCNKEKGCLIQILGIQYSTRKYALDMRPALLAFRCS